MKIPREASQRLSPEDFFVYATLAAYARPDGLSFVPREFMKVSKVTLHAAIQNLLMEGWIEHPTGLMEPHEIGPNHAWVVNDCSETELYEMNDNQRRFLQLIAEYTVNYSPEPINLFNYDITDVLGFSGSTLARVRKKSVEDRWLTVIKHDFDPKTGGVMPQTYIILRGVEGLLNYED